MYDEDGEREDEAIECAARQPLSGMYHTIPKPHPGNDHPHAIILFTVHVLHLHAFVEASLIVDASCC